MIRRVRRTSLLVAFFLLTSAATAYAECAWVLWLYALEMKGRGTEQYSPELSRPTRRECDEEARGVATMWKQDGYLVVGGAPGSPEVMAKKGTRSLKYFCLPDTVDPHGPKGK